MPIAQWSHAPGCASASQRLAGGRLASPGSIIRLDPPKAQAASPSRPWGLDPLRPRPCAPRLQPQASAAVIALWESELGFVLSRPLEQGRGRPSASASQRPASVRLAAPGSLGRAVSPSRPWGLKSIAPLPLRERRAMLPARSVSAATGGQAEETSERGGLYCRALALICWCLKQ